MIATCMSIRANRDNYETHSVSLCVQRDCSPRSIISPTNRRLRDISTVRSCHYSFYRMSKGAVRASGLGVCLTFAVACRPVACMVFRAADAVNDIRPLSTARSRKERVIDSVRRPEPRSAMRSMGAVWPHHYLLSCAPAAIGLNVRERVNGSIFDKISRVAKRYHADPTAKQRESVVTSMAPAMRIFWRRANEDRYPNPVIFNGLSRDASVWTDAMILHSLYVGEHNDPVATDRFGGDDGIIANCRYRHARVDDALQ